MCCFLYDSLSDVTVKSLRIPSGLCHPYLSVDSPMYANRGDTYYAFAFALAFFWECTLLSLLFIFHILILHLHPKNRV